MKYGSGAFAERYWLRKLKHRDHHRPQCHFVHHNAHMDWTGIKPGPRQGLMYLTWTCQRLSYISLLLGRVCSQTQLCQLRCLMTILDNYMFRPLLAIFRLSLRELYIYITTLSIKMFNDYIRQLHVSASTGHLQVVFKRTLYICI